MRRTSQMLTLLAGLTLVLGAYLAATAQSRTATEAHGATAVVNIQQVFDALDEKKAIQADLQQQLEKLDREKDTRQGELQRLSDDLKMLNPDSESHKQKQEIFELKAVELKAWLDYQRAKVERENALQLEMLYGKIVRTTGDVAKANGFELVLFAEPAEVRGSKPDQVASKIFARKVIWASDQVDLTVQVTEKMNLLRKNPGSATPAPDAAGSAAAKPAP